MAMTWSRTNATPFLSAVTFLHFSHADLPRLERLTAFPKAFYTFIAMTVDRRGCLGYSVRASATQRPFRHPTLPDLLQFRQLTEARRGW